VVDGKSFDFLVDYFSTDQEIKEKILSKIAVFGRTKPEQKKRIIEELKIPY